MCRICRWSRSGDCHGPASPYRVVHPHETKHGAKEGDCTYFEPSRLTRIVRLVGLRRPSMRPG